jgi:hypothetical protein
MTAPPWGLAEVPIPDMEFEDDEGPLAEALAKARGTMGRAGPVAAELSANRGYTDDPEHGRPNVFTDRVGEKAIKDLRFSLAEVRPHKEAVLAEAEALTREPELTAISAIQRQELLLLAQSFGALPQDRKLQQLEKAVAGKDPLLASALVRAHPLITGLGAPVLRLLREQEQGARVDPKARERLTAKAERIGAVERVLQASIEAIEAASNRTRLKGLGLTTLRRSDLATDADKAAYIGKHGLDAFKALRP